MERERMTRRCFLSKAAAAAAGFAVLGLGVQCRATPTPEVPERILFIGSDITSANLGVDTHLRELAASRDPPLSIETSRETASLGDYGVSFHARGDTFALDKIREGGWNVVVLQGAPMDAFQDEDFYPSARKLDEEIKKVGAETVFFMLLGLMGPHEGDPIGMRTQVKGCETIAAELGARIAPVGLAGERSIQEKPDLDLIDERAGTLVPSMHSTYLAACVFYATLFGESPVGLSYAPEEISEEERTFLQRMAWETVEEYK